MNRVELLKILELNENATNQAIEDAFYMFTLRARNDKTINIETITKAYTTLMDKEKLTKEQIKENKKKVNKRNALIGIITIVVFILVIALLEIYLISPSEQVNINYTGAYHKGNFNTLGNYIENSGVIKSVYIGAININGDKSELLQKDMDGNILFFEQFDKTTLDLFVLDDFSYNYFKDKNIFIDLSNYLIQLGISSDDNRLLKYDGKVIAIDMTNNQYLQTPYSKQYKMIIAIGKNNHGNNICIETIKLLLQ